MALQISTSSAESFVSSIRLAALQAYLDERRIRRTTSKAFLVKVKGTFPSDSSQLHVVMH